VYGGLVDRAHDLLLCGVDPSLVDLSMSLDQLKSGVVKDDEDDKARNDDGIDDDDTDEEDGEEEKENHQCVYREMETLLKTASHPWNTSNHTYLYGPQFKACIASVCLVKVTSMHLV
jgi:hypothetical protein